MASIQGVMAEIKRQILLSAEADELGAPHDNRRLLLAIALKFPRQFEIEFWDFGMPIGMQIKTPWGEIFRHAFLKDHLHDPNHWNEEILEFMVAFSHIIAAGMKGPHAAIIDDIFGFTTRADA